MCGFDWKIVCHSGLNSEDEFWRKGAIRANNYDIYIGDSKIPYKPAEFLAFDGLIEEVMIYNRAMNARDVHLLYSNTLKWAPVT